MGGDCDPFLPPRNSNQAKIISNRGARRLGIVRTPTAVAQMNSGHMDFAVGEEPQCGPTAALKNNHPELKLPSVFGREQRGRRVATSDNQRSLNFGAGRIRDHISSVYAIMPGKLRRLILDRVDPHPTTDTGLPVAAA
jgi:hypothetical protein